MRKLILTLLTVEAVVNCFCQVSFQNGYFITDKGNKINCLIKNFDWKNQPRKFTYKLGENSGQETAVIDSVTEFGINNFSKYRRFSVFVDQSSEAIEKLSISPEPEFKKEQVFLKIIIEGKRNLFVYQTVDFVRYFISESAMDPEQLVYKMYAVEGNSFARNTSFRNQLKQYLECDCIKPNAFETVSYAEDALVKLITSYNSCFNGETVHYREKSNKDLFNFYIRPGLNYSGFSFSNDLIAGSEVDYGKQFTFRFGFEAEFLLPFNRNKWALILEPDYQYYSASKKIYVGNTNTEIDYKSIEVNFGVRHYFFLRGQSKLFLNAVLISDIPFNSHITGANYNQLDLASVLTAGFGAGYQFKNRFGAELKYNLKRDLLIRYLSWRSSYNTASFILSYRLF